MRITEKEINEQIQKKYERFYTSPYDGFIPPRFKEMFRKAVMEVQPANMEIKPLSIKAVLETPEHDLNRVQFGVMMNMIMSIPLKHLFESPEQAMEEMQPMVEAMVEYNAKTEKLAREMAIEKQSKMRLAGLTKETAKIGAGKIVTL